MKKEGIGVGEIILSVILLVLTIAIVSIITIGMCKGYPPACNVFLIFAGALIISIIIKLIEKKIPTLKKNRL